jgi:hypothetical protein
MLVTRIGFGIGIVRAPALLPGLLCTAPHPLVTPSLSLHTDACLHRRLSAIAPASRLLGVGHLSVSVLGVWFRDLAAPLTCCRALLSLFFICLAAAAETLSSLVCLHSVRTIHCCGHVASDTV